jgi:hypothetical protein
MCWTLLKKEEMRDMVPLSKLLSFKALIAVWLATFGLVAVFVSPMTFATGALLVMVGLVVPAVTILLWKDPPPTVAEVLNRVEQSARKH